MHVHFIGIGGIGTSALAQYFLHQGWQVSGSDASRSEITDSLRKRGAQIFIGHRTRNLGSLADKVIYSAAVKEKNSELKKASRLNLVVQSYAQALGELTKSHFTIAVSGSHGKSTTTALIALVLVKAGLDPTVIVGTKLKEFNGTNFRPGKSRYLVIEADEYDRSFHNYYPDIAVITNIDKEHLDTYKTLGGVIKGFSRYLKNLKPGGIIIANWKDKNILQAVKDSKSRSKIVFYNHARFQPYQLGVPGFHNQLNAQAAWQAVKKLGVKRIVAEKTFAKYEGAWRRMERIRPKNEFWKKFVIFSDYAHHPTEIKATLRGLRLAYPEEKIICVFQPHQQDRLTRLFNDYASAFSDADQLLLLPAYVVKGRDNYLQKRKTSRDLCAVIKKDGHLDNVAYVPSFNLLSKKIISHRQALETIFIFMGAGSIDNWTRDNL